jgi:hypothetical protein
MGVTYSFFGRILGLGVDKNMLPWNI